VWKELFELSFQVKFPVPDGEASTTLTKLHLVTHHRDVGECAAGPAGRVGAFSRVVWGGDLSTQGLQLRLVTRLQGQKTNGTLRSIE